MEEETMYDHELTLTITNQIVTEYNNYYFSCHPKARKPPIKTPCHPSINVWMILKRPIMNALKQKWKDFMVWFVEYLGYTNMIIVECEIICTTYFKTRIRHDTDNTVPKFILDGLVESCLLIDDDEKHLTSLTLKCGYDKDNPRTELLIKYKE